MVKMDFSVINKTSAKSFNEQRNLIKRMGKGQTVLCSQCQQPLQLSVSSAEEAGVSCAKGCTHISLEVET
jgi:hypothetical protein